MTTTKLAERAYICPICRKETVSTTNHEGFIYSGCVGCGEGTLMPAKLYAQLDTWMNTGLNPDNLPVVQLHHFRYDLTKLEQAARYTELVGKLQAQGYVRRDHLAERGRNGFSHMHMTDHKYAMVASVAGDHDLKEYGNKDAQLLSTAGRLYWWREFLVPNTNLRIGYYLTAATVEQSFTDKV